MTIAIRATLLAFACLWLLQPLPAGSVSDSPAVTLLEESFDASPAERKRIYTEVIKLDGLSLGAGSAGRLARAVAYFQRGMDGEDELVDLLVRAAPALSRLNAAAPDFVSDFRSAADEFDALSSEYPFVTEYSAAARIVAGNWRDGQSLFRLAREFGGQWPVSRFTRRILLLSGCRLLLDGEYTAAMESFAALWDESPSSSQAQDAYRLANAMRGTGGVRLSAARMLEWGQAQGRSGHSELTSLIERFPGTPEAEAAYLQIFDNIPGGFESRTLNRNRANAILMEKLFKEFQTAFPNSPRMGEAQVLRAEMNYRTGKKCEAIARKNDYSWRTYKNSRRRGTANTYSSYSDIYFGRVAEAADECRAKYQGSDARMGTGLYRALSLVELDEYDQALALLIQLLSEGPSDKRAVEIASYAGLLNYHEGHYTEAVALLKNYTDPKYQQYEGWQRAMLFLGKSRMALAANDLAGRDLATLSRVYPYSYYGIRARLLLHDVIREMPGMQPWFSQLPVMERPVFPDTFSTRGVQVAESADHWRGLGFHSEASYIYGHGLSLDPDDLLLRFRYHENFLEAGLFHRVLRSFRGPFRDYLAKGGDGLPDNFWDIAFLNPEENIETIRREGERRGIPPGLITAVMRQESNFHPKAKSHAGAIGLMQLLPSVGRNLARGEGIGTVNASRLFDPDVNIRLGTKFLAQNLKRFDGNIALAISSYNADPRNLPAWLERSHPAGTGEDQFDLDLFIELIPLEETYFYNIIVLTNYWRYQELGGEQKNLFAWKLFQFSEVNTQ